MASHDTMKNIGYHSVFMTLFWHV